MPLADWFATAVDQAPTAAQQDFLDELEVMLDLYQPAQIDHFASTIEVVRSSIAMTIYHAREPDAKIAVFMSATDAQLEILGAFEHLDASDSEPDRTWPRILVDAVAGGLRGDYEVETTTRLGVWTSTRMFDLSNPSAPEWMGTSCPLWGWAFKPFPATVSRTRTSFDVQAEPQHGS